MTWGECKLAALQKMFSAGQKIENDEAVRDMLAAMPFAANEAIQRIAAVRPMRRWVEWDAEPGGEQGFDLMEYAPDLKNTAEPEVYLLDERGTPRLLPNWRMVGGRWLVLPPLEKKASLRLGYEAEPPCIGRDWTDEHRLPLREDEAALLPLYIAGELYKEDDLRAAVYYMNEFETGLLSLLPADRGAVSNTFVSESGW